MGKTVRKPTAPPPGEPAASQRAEIPERWSIQRKTELVLRLLRGEALDAVPERARFPRTSWRAGSGCSWNPGGGD